MGSFIPFMCGASIAFGPGGVSDSDRERKHGVVSLARAEL